MRRAWRLALCLGLGSLALTGCGSGRASEAQRTGRSSGRTVPVRVYRLHAAAAALVRLSLEGHPYYFLVDTGAGRTIIDARVARKLGLRDDGPSREFSTLGCKVSSQPVVLRSWRLGDAALPVTTVFAQKLLVPRAFSGLPLGGLLGADFLSRFGTVAIAFTHRQLILGGKAPRDGRTGPIRVLRRAGTVLATTEVQFDNRRARFIVDTGAAISLIDSKAATQLGLRIAGPSRTVAGAVCRRAVTLVLVRDWSVAGLRLPEAIIGGIADALPKRYLREGLVGILGTSTLARRGILTIDFAHARLILGGTIR